ncbi:glycosyltransferase family 4 protein [Agreia sp. PsM10]|uniref:glycosyltransferase family 4 protein n=1 Tax=Agreia sp. PsM10 TaxID=3030533 RepID=UPI00263B985D|nr:glycosyltransferase family 4 protein [Agreia sp. PsM10]MDN4641337.1 glycosyltransferase family 4 protein [Agreia sp. PsM10]
MTEVAPELEALRLIQKYRAGSASRTLALLRIKERFDRKVAAALSPDTRVIAGMPGAALQTFLSAEEHTLKVFHEVDAPPKAHNEALLNFYDRRDVVGEIYPQRLVSRVEDELDVANVILSPSSVVTRQLIDSGIRKETIFQAPYGVDFTRFAPVEELRSQPLNRPVRLVYVGQISNRKGIGFLVQAARNLRVEIDLIGPLVNKKLLDALPQNVRYKGVLPHEDVNIALARADAFVFPSIEDACPLAVIEAAGAGLPVIVTSCTGSAELLEDQDRSLIEPGDVKALRTAMVSAVPLPWLEREARGNRMRSSSPKNRILSWGQYTDLVTAEIVQRSINLTS